MSFKIVMFLYLAEVVLYCLSFDKKFGKNPLGRRRGNFKIGFHVPKNKRNELVIFDLDRAIWPFVSDDCEHRLFQTGNNTSSPEERLAPFPESLTVLKSLREQGYFVGLISDCKDAAKATRLLNLFSLPEFFDFTNIFPRHKTKALQKLRRATGISYENILFFEYPSDVTSSLLNLGITIVPVDEKGLTMELMKKGLEIFSKRSRRHSPLY